MWIEGLQEYNKFAWQHKGDTMSLKKVLLDEMGFSIRGIVALKREDAIRINGKKKLGPKDIKDMDIIQIELKEDPSEFIPIDLNLHIVYEDFDMLVINKNPGIVVHPTKGTQGATLAEGLNFHFKQNNVNSKIRFVNRLDMDTSGLMIVAKNSYTHNYFAEKMSMDEIDKCYMALCKGTFKEKEGILNFPIYKNEGEMARVVDDRGQNAITHFELVKTFEGDINLVKLRLETGRTHQIRVHLSHIGCPILGDELYGGDMSLMKRQALHCYKLRFKSPRKENEDILEIDLPQDMKDCIRTIEGF